jgi:hypothetical protein
MLEDSSRITCGAFYLQFTLLIAELFLVFMIDDSSFFDGPTMCGDKRSPQ